MSTPVSCTELLKMWPLYNYNTHNHSVSILFSVDQKCQHSEVKGHISAGSTVPMNVWSWSWRPRWIKVSILSSYKQIKIPIYLSFAWLWERGHSRGLGPKCFHILLESPPKMFCCSSSRSPDKLIKPQQPQYGCHHWVTSVASTEERMYHENLFFCSLCCTVKTCVWMLIHQFALRIVHSALISINNSLAEWKTRRKSQEVRLRYSLEPLHVQLSGNWFYGLME